MPVTRPARREQLNHNRTSLFASCSELYRGSCQPFFQTPYKRFLNVGIYAYKEWQYIVACSP